MIPSCCFLRVGINQMHLLKWPTLTLLKIMFELFETNSKMSIAVIRRHTFVTQLGLTPASVDFDKAINVPPIRSSVYFSGRYPIFAGKIQCRTTSLANCSSFKWSLTMSCQIHFLSLIGDSTDVQFLSFVSDFSIYRQCDWMVQGLQDKIIMCLATGEDWGGWRRFDFSNISSWGLASNPEKQRTVMALA